MFNEFSDNTIGNNLGKLIYNFATKYPKFFEDEHNEISLTDNINDISVYLNKDSLLTSATNNQYHCLNEIMDDLKLDLCDPLHIKYIKKLNDNKFKFKSEELVGIEETEIEVYASKLPGIYNYKIKTIYSKGIHSNKRWNFREKYYCNIGNRNRYPTKLLIPDKKRA